MPSLKTFMLRAEVMKLYRSVIRMSRHLDQNQRLEVRDFARNSFDSRRHITDETAIRHLLTDGRRQLDQFETAIGMSR